MWDEIDDAAWAADKRRKESELQVPSPCYEETKGAPVFAAPSEKNERIGTHWVGCWEVHHACAVAEVKRLQSATPASEYICKCGIRVVPHRCQTGTDF